MGKNEILQNDKSNTEKSFIKTHYDNIYNIRLRESKKMLFTFDLQKITFTIIRIGILRYTITQVQA